MPQQDLKLMIPKEKRREGITVNAENLLRLNLEYDREQSKYSRKSLEIESMWKHEELRMRAIKYGVCGSVYKRYKCDHCGTQTITHTNSCNLRICEKCCKKQYYRIKSRLREVLKPYSYDRNRYKIKMLREITLTWRESILDTDLNNVIKERREQINKFLKYFTTGSTRGSDKRIKRIFGTIKVFETKRSKRDPTRIHVHAHILTISKYIPKSEISRIWKRITGNWVTWITKRKFNEAIGYLLKHIYKPPEILASDVPMFLRIFANRRRISTTGELFKVDLWSFLPCDMAIICSTCGHDLDGYEIIPLKILSREFLDGIG